MERAALVGWATGFSHNTGSPLSKAVLLTSACAFGIVTLITASALTRSRSSLSVAVTSTSANPAPAAACCASGRSRSARPTSSTSVDCPTTSSQCRPIRPAPTWISRMGSAGDIGLIFLVGLDRAGVGVAVEEVVGVIAQQGRNRALRQFAADPLHPVGDYLPHVLVVVDGVILIAR